MGLLRCHLAIHADLQLRLYLSLVMDVDGEKLTSHQTISPASHENVGLFFTLNLGDPYAVHP